MKERITLSIIWHDHRKPIILSVSKTTLKRFVGIGVLLLLLIPFFFLWGALKQIENHKLLAQQKNVLREKERLEAESQKLLQTKEKLRAIESILLNIQSYLKERGILLEKAKGVGGGSAYKPSADPSSEGELLKFTLNWANNTYKILRDTPLGYPVKGEITSSFGWRKNPFGSGYEFHTGVDIEASHGAPVVATADGQVVFVGTFSDYGKTVIVNHASGYSTLYAHLSSIEVREGQLVKAGQMLGKVGSTGRAKGPHLHYEIILGDKSIDPIKFLSWR